MANDIHDFTVQYNGKGYKFDVFVNTDEDPIDIIKRIQKAARGQKKAACVVGYSNLSPDEVKQFLDLAAKMAMDSRVVEYKIED